jgi:hypothetical protein
LVLSVEMLAQSVAVEIDAADVERVAVQGNGGSAATQLTHTEDGSFLRRKREPRAALTW